MQECYIGRRDLHIKIQGTCIRLNSDKKNG